MDTIRQDLVYALRRLRQAPGFTLVAVATLAVGIGANSAIFSVVNAVLLRPLPYPEADRLVSVASTWKGRRTVYSPQNFLDTAAAARSFEGLAAWDPGGMTLGGAGRPKGVEGAQVSAGFFDLLRVRPVLGRGFAADENEPGRTRVAVLGHALWRERFGADPGAVGRSVAVDGVPHVVVGVAPEGFSYPEGRELWTPLEYDARFRGDSRGAWYLTAIGRLRPGVTVEAADREVAAIAANLARAYPDDNEGVGASVASLQAVTVQGARGALLLLLGAVGFVLLIACVNVANLLLARGAAREAEVAVRVALGAGRGRIVRQLITESLVLAVVGGGAGLLLATLTLDALLALRPAGVPRLAEVRIDGAVAAFATGLSLLTGVLFGCFPAWQAARRTTAQSLREGGRGTVGRGSRLRAGLVVGQTALAMVLLAGAGLLVRSFDQLRRVNPGFEAADALTFRLKLPENAYTEASQRAAFYDQLLARLRALPGVGAAGGITGLPLSGARYSFSFTVKGRPPVPPPQQPSMELRVATPGYFEAMGIPVVQGRAFTGGDGASAPRVVVLSETAVRRYFAGEEPLGQEIVTGMRGLDGQNAGGLVVGVVGDVKDHGLDTEPLPEIYLPLGQAPPRTVDLLLRTRVAPRSLVPAVEDVVRAADPELPVERTRTLEEVVARSISEPRFYMLLLAAFAATALGLAALGIFGVMSYAVAQRSHEIGIRVALGARPVDVLGMVMRHALVLSVAGVAAGLLGALALSRAVASLLFELSPTDPVTLASVAALLTAVALLASYWPARRATRVDPLVALRSE
jgi:predicted permease